MKLIFGCLALTLFMLAGCQVIPVQMARVVQMKIMSSPMKL